jgi:ribosome-associated protein
MLVKKNLTGLQIAKLCAKYCLEKKALEPTIIDLRDIADGPAEYFFICSAQSDPQLKAVASFIETSLKKNEDERPYVTNGTAMSGWIVLDYGSVIAHVMHETKRTYYQLEELWNDGKRVKI